MGKKTAKKSTSFLGTSALTRPLFALGAASVLFGSGSAYALDPGTLPQNPNVVGGKDTFSQSGNTLNVNQSTNRTVIDWRSFDIGSKAQVNFAQPGSSSIAVNRINGSTNPTDIEGGLHANGQVWILNPNGVFFGKSARVDAAGIVASTANINDKAFMAGSNTLQMTGADHGSVSNAGNITVGANGLAAFVAPSVRNSGTINATVGRVALAAGTTYTLDLAGDHLVELGLGSVKAVVDNSGRIVNPGGTIALTAKAAGQVVNSVVNVSGVVTASSATKSGGTIILGADTINTTKTASITADAGTNGTGGTITSVANVQGNYAGTFSATGGSKSGNGGKIETSGHDVAFEGGMKVSASAKNGKAGEWLVDPTEITIDGTLAGIIDASLLGGTSFTVTTSEGAGDGDITLASSINTTTTLGADLTITGRHLFATGGSTVTLNGAGSTLTLNVNAIDHTANPGGSWINDALGMIGSVTGGTTINLGAGTYVIAPGGANYVNVNKSNVTIDGAGEGQTIIDARNASTYGLRVSGPNSNVTLENFTLYGATAAGNVYGLKAENTTNLTLSHITSQGATKSEFDLNGIVGGTLDHLTANGYAVGTTTMTGGNGISFTDSQNIVMTNSVTENNGWGGLAFYQHDDYGLSDSNITVNGSNTFNEANGIYAEDQSTSLDFGTINLSGQGITYIAQNLAGPNDFYTYFRTSKQGAIDTAAAAGPTTAYVQGYAGNVTGNNVFYVGYNTGNATALSIQAAINAAAAGATINVGAGTYAQTMNISKGVDIEGAGVGNTIIQPTALLDSGVGHKYTTDAKVTVLVNGATGVTLNGLTINGNDLGNDAVVLWNNSSGSITNSLIENAKTFDGTQTGQGLGVDASSGNASNLTVNNVTFTNFNKNAIDAVNGNGGTTVGGNINLTVENSTITGAGPTSTIAQNGIVTWEKGGGTINATIDNVSFSGLDYTGADATAAGVLQYGSANGTVTVKNSTFDGSVQVYISTAGGSTNEIDATDNNTFDGVVAKGTDTLAQLYAIQDKLVDSQDDSSNGMVRLVDGQVYVVADKDNIQGGIDGASSGDTVNIQAGTYTGQVVITKDLDIIGAGAGQTIIDATDSMAHSFTGNGNPYHAVVSIEGGNVSIADLTVDGLGKGNTNNRFLGIGIHNANATVTNVDITGIRDGGVAGTLDGVQSGTGLEAFNDDGVSRNVTLTDSTIEDFQKNATAFIGKNLTVDVEGNTITGAGNTPLIAQNGVEFFGVGGTVTGTIKNNTITDISYANSETASSDILLWNASGTNVQGNTLTGTGNTGSSLGVYVTGSTGVTVTANTIKNFEYGMEVDNAAGTGASVTVQNNVITGNAVTVDLGYDETDTSTVNASNNDLSGNLSGIELESSSDTANFSGNWWGTTNANTIEASMTGADAGQVDFSPFLTSGTDTSVAAGFQGSFSTLDVTALGGGGTARIEEGVADVTAGGTVNVLAGNYTLAGELDITKSLTLNGAGVGTTNITSNSTGYGINVTADNVTLENFTFNAPTAHTGTTYGIKVTPDTNAASDRLLNFDIENVTINGGWRTGLDLNGVLGATIHNVSVSNVQNGNGIALTDSANVTLTNVTTTNNAWGGLALYQHNAFYNQQLNNISVDGSNTFNEANGIYEEDQSASLDMGSNVTLAGYNYADIDKSVANDQYTFFQKTKSAALNFATNTTLNGNHLTAANTYVEGWTGSALNNTFEVASGLTIQAAENAAAANGTINVASGTYAENVSVGTQLTFNFGNVNVNSFALTSGGAGSSLNGNLTATGGLSSAGAVSLNGDFTASFIGLNGAVTLTGDTTLDTSAANGNITVASVAGGGNDLSIHAGTGPVQLGSVTNGGALTVDGSAELTGSSYAANSLDFGAIALDNATTLTANGSVTVGSVAGVGNSLSINGASNTLGNVAGVSTLAVTGPTTLTGTSYAAGSLNFGDVTLTGDTTLAASSNVTVASVTGAGNDLSITGVSDTLGNVAGVGALAVSGSATLTGSSYAANSIDFDAITLTTGTTLDAGAVTVASVTGGGNDLSIDGAASLGNVAGVGALALDSAATLTGSTYSASSLDFGGAVTLTNDTTMSATGAVTMASVTGGGNDLSITGASNSLGDASGLGALAVTGSATLTGSTYSGASLAFNGAVTLTNDTTLDATGAVTVASVTGGGNDLTIDGSSSSLGNVAGVGALAVTGPATLTGTSYVAASESFGGAVTLTGDTTLDTSAANGAIVVASVDGSSAGGQALSLNAGKGTVSLGNLGAATRLGAVTDASATTLTGSTYNANSFLFGGDVTLTAATTTLNTTQSSSAAGDITFNGDIFGKTDGGQSLTLIAGAGTGAASANGDITLQNAGTTAVNLNNMTVSGNNFTALTVDLAGNYNGLLTGNQVFAADTLNVKGDATSTVGGNASGHVVAGGDVSFTTQGDVSGTISGSNVNLSGDDVNATVTASNSATVTGNTVEGSYTADTVSITANNNVNAAVNATDLTLSAANGSVDGTWTTIDTSGSGVVNVNGQATVGVASDLNPNQLVVEGFTLPAGTTIGANGALILPQGVLLGLLSPGGGKPKMILVHSVQQLGELLASGYSVIVIDLSNKDSGKPLQLASN